MAVKTIEGKSATTDLEKDVRIEMIRHDISQVEIADYEGVQQSAINMRLKRLTHKKARDFKELIREVAAWKREQTSKRATG